MNTILVKTIKFFLFLTVFVPLVYWIGVIFPFVTIRAWLLRTLVEAALVLFLILLVLSDDYWKKFLAVIKKPLVIVTGLFVLSALISSFVAVDVYKSFLGEAERMGGFFGLAHYWALLVLMICFFEKKDWLNYFRLTLGVGLIIGFYGLLQYFNVQNFPLMPPLRNQASPDSFLGNAAYVGGHFLFMLGLAWIFFGRIDVALRLSSAKGYGEARQFRWGWLKVFWLAVIAFSVAVVMISGVRGPLVGMIVGILAALVYLAYRAQISRKIVSAGFILIILLAAVFWVTKSSDFWLAVPGLNRIARTTIDHPTVRTRILSWGTSWEAFKERPLLGWGVDNFDIAYNKYYNPDYLLYEDKWFDRAHNKLFDALVMQGLLGLLIYLGVFGVAGWQLFKYKDYKLASPLVFIFSSYFVHNFFLFDHESSYLMFFTVLGFLAANSGGSLEVKKEAGDQYAGDGNWLLIFSAIGIMAIVYYFYFYTFVPFRQARAFITARQIDDGQRIFELSDRFLKPYSYTRGYIADQFINFMKETRSYGKEELDFLTDRSITAMEEFIKRQPYDPRKVIRLTEAYIDRGKRTGNKKYYEKAVAALEKALELAPKRQNIYYHMAYALVPLDKKEEAIATARKAVELAPKVGQSHYVLGLILSLTDEQNRAEAEKEIDLAFELGGLSLISQDYVNLGYFYSQNILFYVKRRDAEAVIKNAEKLKNIDEELKKDIEIIIQGAQEGRWRDLERALKIN